MDRIKRNERLAAMSRILTSTPNRLYTLSYFTEMFGSAKSTISEDLSLLAATLQMFDLVYTLTRGGPSRATNTMVVHIYSTAFDSLNKMGYATAMSELLFAFIMLITIVMYTIMNKTSD